jgi:hypothetical protein
LRSTTHNQLCLFSASQPSSLWRNNCSKKVQECRATLTGMGRWALNGRDKQLNTGSGYSLRLESSNFSRKARMSHLPALQCYARDRLKQKVLRSTLFKRYIRRMTKFSLVAHLMCTCSVVIVVINRRECLSDATLVRGRVSVVCTCTYILLIILGVLPCVASQGIFEGQSVSYSTLVFIARWGRTTGICSPSYLEVIRI